ncbi:hypothetical protein [Frigidibacter sp.]|uniref:hypothetical protein n=1 Tax=Frigidibacter sp. TaxID=2586418 RepID=UPI00273741AD|nr:hypothetical protein [Frigidibacter sp.]MDP3342644.1 hypothetical protein [Frigidibacter sp.]
MSEFSISDHIGRIGESWFDLLTNKAKLLVGRIEPDRLGRDRVLEFPAKARLESEPYDKRAAPLGCSIQIKTILATNDRVSVKLSVAERLAIDNRPTLVCIIRVDDCDNVVDMHLLHILDDNLSRILQRLREEFSKGTDALNRVEITFGVAAAHKVEQTPDALKEALTLIIGEDMNAYAAEKIRQRDTAGYQDGGRYSIDITFEEITPRDLIDGMLGLKKLGIKGLKPFEERFSIKLPGGLPIPGGMEGAVLQITPTPVDAGVISIFSRIRDERIELNCDLIVPIFPAIPIETMKMIARSELLDAIFSVEQGAIQLTNTFDESSAHPIGEWLKIFKLWDVVFAGDSELTVRTNDGRQLLSGSFGDAVNIDDRPEYLNEILSLLEMANSLLIEASAANRPVSLRDLKISAKALTQIHGFFFRSNDLGPFSFEMQADECVESGEYPALFVSTFVLGEDVYAYALKLALSLEKTGEHCEFRSTSMTPLHISKVADDEAALGEFANHTAKLSGTRITILPSADASDEMEGFLSSTQV